MLTASGEMYVVLGRAGLDAVSNQGVANCRPTRGWRSGTIGQHAGHHDGFIHDGQSDLHIASGASLQNEMIGIA